MGDTRFQQEQKAAASAHMKRVRAANANGAGATKTKDETSEEAKVYAAASQLASELIEGKYVAEDEDGKKTERALMLECIKQLVDGGKTLMENILAAKTHSRAILFGHLSQSVTITSLEELKTKAGVSSGPLYEQVYRVFASRPDVTRIEIIPSHIS